MTAHAIVLLTGSAIILAVALIALWDAVTDHHQHSRNWIAQAYVIPGQDLRAADKRRRELWKDDLL